jgi:hypothetical protein
MTREQIRAATEAFLGISIDANDLSACPFAGILHDTSTGGRACRWTWNESDGMPHVKCFHAKCQDAWHERMRDLYKHLRAMQYAERGDRPARPVDPLDRPLPREPKATPPRAVPFDADAAARLAARCRLAEVTPAMLSMLSPVDLTGDRREHGRLLIDTLYNPGEHVLVFTKFASQGQYLHTASTENFYTLASTPGVKAKPCHRLPNEGPEGVWFLSAPVLGTWQPNPNKRDANGNALPGRRHTACCTRFPYLVLESDVLDPGTWLRILVQLEAPIAAVYTSGGKSLHALVKVDAASAEQFNLIAQNYKKLARVGADPAAITAVRLTRLPGCLRLGGKDSTGKYSKYSDPRLQKLIYLNPEPYSSPLQNLL